MTILEMLKCMSDTTMLWDYKILLLNNAIKLLKQGKPLDFNPNKVPEITTDIINHDEIMLTSDYFTTKENEYTRDQLITKRILQLEAEVKRISEKVEI